MSISSIVKRSTNKKELGVFLLGGLCVTTVMHFGGYDIAEFAYTWKEFGLIFFTSFVLDQFMNWLLELGIYERKEKVPPS